MQTERNAWKTQWMQNSILNLLVSEGKEWVAVITSDDTQWNGRHDNERRERQRMKQEWKKNDSN